MFFFIFSNDANGNWGHRIVLIPFVANIYELVRCVEWNIPWYYTLAQVGNHLLYSMYIGMRGSDLIKAVTGNGGPFVFVS